MLNTSQAGAPVSSQHHDRNLTAISVNPRQSREDPLAILFGKGTGHGADEVVCERGRLVIYHRPSSSGGGELSGYIGGCWRGQGRSTSEFERAARDGEVGLGSITVQIIESTPFGVRSSIMTFSRTDSNVRFVLFPMLHLGAPTFYAEVARRLGKCDLILAEGVAGRRTSLITLSYRLAGKIRRFGLTEQSRGLQLADLGVPVENVDATASQFSRSWRRAPRYARILLLALAPLFGLWLIISGSRSMIAQQMEINDLPDRDEAFMPDSLARV